MRHLPRTTTALLAVLLVVSTLGAKEPPVLEVNQKIIAFERSQSQVMANLQHLSDVIGARLTGSEQLKRANEWVAERFKEYGLTNVRQEAWTLNRGWRRGAAAARLIEPNNQALTIASAGWAPGTNGPVTGNAILVDVKTDEDLAKYQGKLKGRIILAGAPRNPNAGMFMPPPPQPGQPTQPPQDRMQMYRRIMELRRKTNDLFRSEGVGLIVRDAGKAHGLFTMASAGTSDEAGKIDVGPTPTIYMAHEHYAMIYRLLERNSNVTLEVNVTNSATPGPVEVFNTVGEIRGTERPDEVVILGAHLDSWDLGTGATDNGAGCMAVLEAARALTSVGARPKRTIRFVMFTGEEQGLMGATEYVKAHRHELAKISAVLVMDSGTGKITGIPLQGNQAAKPVLEEALASLRELGVTEITLTNEYGTDHLPFDSAGVPAFAVNQDLAEYAKTHHSQTDTFDKALKDDLVQASTVLAVAAYNIAQLPSLLPRKTVKPAATGY